MSVLRTDAEKGHTVYAYDSVGNLTQVAYPISPALNLKYDALNRLTNLVDAVGTTIYAYDAAGQLLSEGGLWPNDTVTFSYANRLRRSLGIASPTGSSWSQSYNYDSARRNRLWWILKRTFVPRQSDSILEIKRTLHDPKAMWFSFWMSREKLNCAGDCWLSAMFFDIFIRA